MYEPPTEPKKILPYKTYNKIGHLSKSRLGPGDHFIDITAENLLTKQLANNQQLVIVQEKLDGSNVSVVRYNGRLYALGRSGYDCSESNQEQHRMFHRWVMSRDCNFSQLLPKEGDRVVGEWLALAHGTKYNLCHDPFVPFDLFSGEKQLNFLEFFNRVAKNGFITPFVLHIGGSCSIQRGIKLLNSLSYHGAENPEGLIYRLEESGKPKLIAKYVKPDKVDAKYITEGQEIWNYHD